jgi:glycosyltransferase involved in cell wall biosynthesis
MRIVQLISSRGFYGAEGVVVLLSNRLKELGCTVKLGIFNAELPQNADFVEAANQADLEVWSLDCLGRLDSTAIMALARSLRDTKTEVLHTHGYKANLFGLAAARIAGCAVVATCHNWTGRTSSLRGYATLDRWFLPHFDAVVAVSEGVAEDLLSRGLPRSRLQIIANGVDTVKFRQHVPCATSSPILGVLSRLSIEKGLDIFIRALPSILQEFPELQCVVAGEGPERAALLTLAEKLGVRHALKLIGFSRDTVSFLSSCTVVVHPSRIDGMPLSILEAMAAAKPIIASAVGEIPALLLQGEAGLLVTPGDPVELAASILTLLRSPVRRAQLSEAAARQALRYDASAMADSYLNLYKQQLLRPSLSISPSPRSHQGMVP